MKYYLGVDGGGTKTRYVLVDENMNVCLDKTTGSGYFITLGKEAFINLMLEIKSDVTAICGDNLEHAFFGMAGVGEFHEDTTAITNLITEVFAPFKVDVANDSIGVWAGGLLCEDGIGVICGTGSIATGVSGEHTMRVGGWGFLAGDDGSAYWIALKTINAYSKMYDGRFEKTVLYHEVNTKFKLDEVNNFVKLIYRDMEMQRPQIAQFATLCTKAADEGCPYCIEILKEAASEIVLKIDVIANTLKFNDPIKVSYTGGVFNSEVFYKQIIHELNESKHSYELVIPVSEPAFGSALYAYILSGHKLTDELKKHYLEKISA